MGLIQVRKSLNYWILIEKRRWRYTTVYLRLFLFTKKFTTLENSCRSPLRYQLRYRYYELSVIYHQQIMQEHRAVLSLALHFAVSQR